MIGHDTFHCELQLHDNISPCCPTEPLEIKEESSIASWHIFVANIWSSEPEMSEASDLRIFAEIKDQISMIEVLYHETDAFQEAQGQGEDLKGAEHLGRRTDQGNEASTSGPGKVIRQHIKKFVQVLPVNSFAYAQYDHLRRTIDVLIALGKDPRKGEMSPTEITTAISRDRLPTPVRIEWNKKTKADQTMAANLGRSWQTDEARAQDLNWLARTKWRRCEDSLRIEETPEMETALLHKRNAAHAALYSMRTHQG
ncbi:hypothetical protein T4B_11261 [Trichinella pseudospiralis]|uniref:Uncharacterized protein n=1 Tax=Trichinella pseudospiralis TaxID=6337 RepID=A0A0V1JHM9_TRIPS|nr:hypothetical protein T4B_11261 [Trichinella pseudospiralis]